jgi:predicted ATP-dependent serine protease
VIDSITTLDIPAKKLWELYGKHPKVSFINIHHALKDGDNFKGDSDYQHDIDVEIKVWFDEKAKKHFAQCVKNRWCGNHEIIEVF